MRSLDEFAFGKLLALEQAQLRRTPTATARDGIWVERDGRHLLSFSCNDYLNLSQHPRVVKAAIAATRRHGVGAGASRLVTGNHPLYAELESRLARFKGAEAACVFGSGYLANLGIIPALIGADDLIVLDELCHACLYAGAKLSGSRTERYRHLDVDAAQALLAAHRAKHARALILTDGVFSMDGDIGPLPALCDLAEKYGAIMMVDDAHASGVLGRNGRGTIDHFHVHGRVDVQVGTLSKAIGSLGGYVCGSRDLIDFLYHRARPFLFSTSHPPSVAATCIAAFDVLENEPERIEQLWENTRYFKKELGNAGFNIGGVNTPASETPITPVIVGEGRLAMKFSRELFKEGVMATGIAFPTVPEGKARIRTIVTATHTREELAQALEIMRRVARRLGIVQ